MASRALKNAMLPPAVTTTRLPPASVDAVFAGQFPLERLDQLGDALDGLYLWFSGSARKPAMRSAACGGGP